MLELRKALRWVYALLLCLAALGPAAWAKETMCPAQAVCPTNVGKMNFDALLNEDVGTLAARANQLKAKKACKWRCLSNADTRRMAEDRILGLVEKALRAKGNALEEIIAAKKQAAESMKKSKQQNGDESDSSTEENDLACVKETVNFSEQQLVINAEKYDDYFFRLNTGYEFVAIDKFFDKGEPRISLLVNRRLGGEQVTDDRDGFWHHYGGRYTFAALLESSAETSITLPNDQAASPAKPSAAAAPETWGTEPARRTPR